MRSEEKAWLTDIHVGYFRAKAEYQMTHKFRVGPPSDMSPVKSPGKVNSPQVAYLVLEGSEELIYNPDFRPSPEKEVSPFCVEEEEKEPLLKPEAGLSAQVQRKLELLSRHATVDSDEAEYL